jgi:hypothetical protein
LLPPLRRGKVIHGMALAEERRGMNAYDHADSDVDVMLAGE